MLGVVRLDGLSLMLIFEAADLARMAVRTLVSPPLLLDLCEPPEHAAVGRARMRARRAFNAFDALISAS